jgi:propanol-preferring alcohol dehydrogenase
MKVALLNEINKLLVIEDKPLPDPAAFQVRIKVVACGLCLTDKHIVTGELKPKKLPLIPGHQIVGHIDKLGSSVLGFKVGDLVGVTWLNKTCGRCEYCNSGKENLCDNAKFTGFDVDGGFCEYTLAESDFIIKLPPKDDLFSLAPLLCAGVIGYRSFKLSEIKHNQKIGLVGFGASAHIVLQIAKHYHCKVYVFTRQEEHKNHAKSLKADFVGDLGDNIDTLLDAVILFAPRSEFVKESLNYLKKGAKLIINAICMNDVISFKYDAIYYERVVQSASNVTREDMKEFIDLAYAIPIQTKYEKKNLEDVNEAIEDMKKSKIPCSIVLVP